jgi:hypothetical protein
MRIYDPNLPLIAVHIPKTAGTSVRALFERWFGDGLLPHYPISGMPPKYDLVQRHSAQRPVVVYGHFNGARGFGVGDYYPEAEQFVTIIRDPFEQRLSGYFYWKKLGRRPHWLRDDDEFNLRNATFERQDTFLDFFPVDLTMHNYQEHIESRFIAIGLTERLDESLTRIATRLGQTYEPGQPPRLNVAERDEEVPAELREEFVASRPLEYAVYDYVRAMYE